MPSLSRVTRWPVSGFDVIRGAGVEAGVGICLVGWLISMTQVPGRSFVPPGFKVLAQDAERALLSPPENQKEGVFATSLSDRERRERARVPSATR
jgi:hypothetical protein